MKFRNFLIVLLAILMAFVAVSCEDEPGDQVQPTPAAKDTIAKITVNKGIETSVWGNEKIQLEWNLGADSEGIQDGSVITLQFRTNRAPYEFDLRTNKKGVFLRDSEDNADKKQDVRWVYQESEDSLDSLSLGADGWYTLKYTFGEDAKSGTPDYDTYRYTNLGVQFKCLLMVGDVFEVKNVTLDGKALPLTDAINIGKHCSIEIGTDHDWTLPKTYVVVYALNGTWDGDDGTEAEIVAAGGKPTGIKAENGFTITYTDEDDELVVLSDLSIEEDTVINYTKVGDPRNVTFKVGDETFLATVVENGQNASKPATDPTKTGGYQFAAWCADSGLETEFNFAETPITADTILYAKFNKVWTVSFSMNGKAGTAPENQIIVDGQTATAPASNPKTSGFRFQNWKLSDAVFNFDTPITADIELVADWIDAETVTFRYCYNYDNGADPDYFENTSVFVDEPAEKPEDPKRAEFVFLGWFDAATDGAEYTFTEDVTVAKTLYAYWEDAPIVKLTASKGRNDGWDSYDKFELVFTTTGANKTIEEVKNGDVLSIKFRTTRNPDQFNVRTVTNDNGDHRWVYEKASSALTSYDTATYAEAGNWIVATYEFGDYADRVSGNKENHAMTDALYEGVIDFAFHFRGDILAGDYIEIKSILWNDEPIDIVKAATAALGKSGDVVRSADYITEIDIEDSIWTGDVTYNAFFFANPTEGGGTAYSKASTCVSATTVANGGKLSAPSAPSLDGFTFDGWSTAKDGSDPWDFENDTVSATTKLYAIWTPVTP